MTRLFTLAVALAAICGAQVSAQDVHFNILPLCPTDNTPVSIKAWTWFGDTGQMLDSVSYERDEYQIDMDVIIQDLHGMPGVAFYQVVTPCGGSVDCGLLPAGLYEVNADVYVIPWASETPQLRDSGYTTFTVVPEPSSLVMLLGTILLPMCFARQGCRAPLPVKRAAWPLVS